MVLRTSPSAATSPTQAQVNSVLSYVKIKPQNDSRFFCNIDNKVINNYGRFACIVQAILNQDKNPLLSSKEIAEINSNNYYGLATSDQLQNYLKNNIQKLRIKYEEYLTSNHCLENAISSKVEKLVKMIQANWTIPLIIIDGKVRMDLRNVNFDTPWHPDLSGANFSNAILHAANLSKTDCK